MKLGREGILCTKETPCIKYLSVPLMGGSHSWCTVSEKPQFWKQDTEK